MSKNAKNAGRRGEGTLAVLLVLAILGFLASLYLNHVHYKVHTDPSYSSICSVSEEVNCETVALSPYSVFLGLPVSYWGMTVHVLYLLIAGLALIDSRRRRREGMRGWALLIVMAVAGIGFSSLLLYVSHFLIQSLCPFCMVIYVLNLLVAVTLTIHIVRRRRDVKKIFLTDVRGYLAKPAMGLLAAPIVMIGAAYSIYPKIYDTGSCPGTTDEELCTVPSTYGNPDARIKIIEYSDYECPFCGMTHFALRKAVETWPEDVALVHVNFPLDMACNDLLPRRFHDNACDAARAALST